VSETFRALLKKPWLNNWTLFWLCMAPISLWVLVAMLSTDTTTGEGVSGMISLSVRLAVPWLYLAFAASSMQILFPGALGLWWLRNRKIFGLLFAGAMAWQAFFILWLVTVQRDYYVSEVYVLRDALEGVIGYTFLVAMTVTSFMPVRKRMKPRHWKWLHTIGIYSLWVYAFSVYWWALSFYENPRWVDFAYYYGGLATWCLRALAWRKKRVQHLARQSPARVPHAGLVAVGALVAALGLLAANTGVLWQGPAEALLRGHSAMHWAELYLPYWPFEPFLPLVVIAIGLWISTRPGAVAGLQGQVPGPVQSGTRS
jgi:hypothetical protein